MSTNARWRAFAAWIRAELGSILTEPERATDAHPPDVQFHQSFTTWMR